MGHCAESDHADYKDKNRLDSLAAEMGGKNTWTPNLPLDCHQRMLPIRNGSLGGASPYGSIRVNDIWFSQAFIRASRWLYFNWLRICLSASVFIKVATCIR